MSFSKSLFSFFAVFQVMFVVLSMPVEAHWHHDHVVIVEPGSPYYHPDHVVVVEGRHHAKIYEGHPYYYYTPQYYYEPAPAPVVVVPASSVNLNVHL
jgi:hypothetical protein